MTKKGHQEFLWKMFLTV